MNLFSLLFHNVLHFIFRGPGGPPHEASSPYKRSRPQSPSGSQMRAGPSFYQDPRYGMAVAAVAAGGYGSIYRDPFQPTVSVSCIYIVYKILDIHSLAHYLFTCQSLC